MDNNYVEQAIQPFTIERENFVFIDSSNRTHTSAMIYNLLETVKANYLNVSKYFELLLTEIPTHVNDTDLSFLDNHLPWLPYIQEKYPNRYKQS